MKTPSKARVHLPVVRAVAPARGWAWARRAMQALAIFALLVAPLLGGFQRLDRAHLSAWDDQGWGLPHAVNEALPMGDAPSQAYEANQMLGGGVASDYFSIPFVDPLAGVVAALSGEGTALLALALGLTTLLGLLAGRAFCGWFCPFGTLSRVVAAILRRVPWRPRPRVVPSVRHVRWAVLVLVLGGALAGAEAPLYLLLPHALVQQSAYAAWLASGGGVVLGWLLGLVIAGVVFGPTAYCATLCPTGSTLSLLGRRRVAQLTIAEPTTCGPHCNLCSHACWLSLDPASGDPGPDCDGCARCVEVCPRTNLRVGLRPRPWQRAGTVVVAALVAAVVLTFARVSHAADPGHSVKPTVRVDRHERIGDVTLHSAITEQPDRPDAPTELAFVLVRGDRLGADDKGRLEEREFYEGPLSVELRDADGTLLERVRFDKPNTPPSTPRRRIYRHYSPYYLRADTCAVLAPVDGWLTEPAKVCVTRDRPESGSLGLGWGFASGLLLFAGLLSLGLSGLAWPQQRLRRARAPAAEGARTASAPPPPVPVEAGHFEP
jgi:ferredoxin-type protein NapH